jgi:hypothetical protein
MNQPENFPEIQIDQQTIPWLKSFLASFQTQAQTIQEQAQTIQKQAQIIQEQAEQITILKKTIQELRDELNRLKKLPKRPKFRASGETSKSSRSSNNQGQSPAKKTIHPKSKENVLVKALNVPSGARFKGYQNYTIQELTIIPKEVTYELEVWQAPDGTYIRATLPPEIDGSHFGPTLRSMIHNLYANGMTQPAIFDFLVGMGIDMSEGQVHNILVDEAHQYQQQSELILAAGLQEAPYIRTDDTGVKHQHQNAYCTHIGGEYFAYYKSTPSKSRINFLNIFLQGKEKYIINEAFIWHLFQSGVEDDILNAFESCLGKCYRKKKGLFRLLDKMGLGNKKLRLCCVEAGLVGFIQEKILKPGQVLLSDRAGQFAVFDHAGCWIHMERPLRKLDTKTVEAEAELKRVREAIWTLYARLREVSLTQQGKEEIHKLYDQLVAMQVTSPGVQEVINNFRVYREEMLKALDHPGLPLHNNDSERDIRGMVKFRNISGSTKSIKGQIFRDSLMTLKQTCFRLGQSFWEYLNKWFQKEPIDLAQCVRERYGAIIASGSP